MRGDLMWYMYILYSEKIDKYYVGYTDNLEKRLERHNSGWGRFTKPGIPWKIRYFEEYEQKSDAIKRERQIKKRKSRKCILDFVQNAGGRPE